MHPLEEFWFIRIGSPEFGGGKTRVTYWGIPYFIDNAAYHANEAVRLLVAFTAKWKAEVYIQEAPPGIARAVSDYGSDLTVEQLDRSKLYTVMRYSGLSHICVDPPPGKESFEPGTLDVRLIFPYEESE